MSAESSNQRPKSLVGTRTYVEDEQRVFRVHDLGRTVRRNLGDFLVPPLVSSLGHRNLVPRSLEHQHMFDFRAFLERGIHNGLGCNSLAASLSLVGRDDDAAATVVGTVSQGFSRETRKDGRVDGTDSGTCEESSSGLPDRGQFKFSFKRIPTHQVMGK